MLRSQNGYIVGLDSIVQLAYMKTTRRSALKGLVGTAALLSSGTTFSEPTNCLTPSLLTTVDKTPQRIAFIIFDGITWLDFFGIYDPISRLKSMEFLPDLSWDICAYTEYCNRQF